MDGGIYLIQEGGVVRELAKTPYDSEDLLQRLLAEHPRILAGDQIDPEKPRRWLLVAREMGVPGEEGGADRWALDHLFLDQDGVPTLVEVKRSTDTRLRREVIGQMLDYAANAVVHWPVEVIQAKVEAACEARGVNSDEELANAFGPEIDVPAFWQTVKTNLQAGRVRLVFVADVIPPELRRVVEFLESQMDPAEVFAIEVSQYVHEATRALVPRLVSVATKPTTPATGGRRKWDEKTFFEEAARHWNKEQLAAIRRLYEASKELADDVPFGTGKDVGSFNPRFIHAGDKSYFTARTDGKVGLNYWPSWSDSEKDYSARLRRAINDAGLFPLSDSTLAEYIPIGIEQWGPRVEDLIRIVRDTFAKPSRRLGDQGAKS